MPKNSFQLSVHSSSHYASLFDRAEISIQPAASDQLPWPELAAAMIGKGALEFEILMPTEQGCILPTHVSTARSVLSQIVEMDEAARAVPDLTDGDGDETFGLPGHQRYLRGASLFRQRGKHRVGHLFHPERPRRLGLSRLSATLIGTGLRRYHGANRRRCQCSAAGERRLHDGCKFDISPDFEYCCILGFIEPFEGPRTPNPPRLLAQSRQICGISNIPRTYNCLLRNA